MKWAELQLRLPSMLQSPNYHEIAHALAELDVPSQEQAFEEIRYNLGGDAVSRIACIMNGITEVSQ